MSAMKHSDPTSIDPSTVLERLAVVAADGDYHVLAGQPSLRQRLSITPSGELVRTDGRPIQ